MPENETYEVKVRAVDVEEFPDGSGVLSVTYQGRGDEQTVRENFASGDFKALFDCCEKIVHRMMVNEFRPNAGVNFEFNLVDEKGISVWHTTPSTFLKMPLKMNMDWTCEHLRTSYKSYTALGMIEMPEEFHLVNSHLPAQELVELLIDSMVSGLEFIGMMFLQREQLGARHRDLV